MKPSWNAPSDTQCKALSLKDEDSEVTYMYIIFQIPWNWQLPIYLCEVLYGNNEGKGKY